MDFEITDRSVPRGSIFSPELSLFCICLDPLLTNEKNKRYCMLLGVYRYPVECASCPLYRDKTA